MPRPPRPWFRFYIEALNDPKVLRLTDREHRVWVDLLCVACSNEGKIVLSDLPLLLRKPAKVVEPIVASLTKQGFLETVGDGVVSPHNWDGRQYTSDVSTERVKRFRERPNTVSSTVTETSPEQSRAETDTENRADTEQNAPPAHPFAFAFSHNHQTRNAGRPPPRTQMAEAIALERDYGAETCIEIAAAYDWEKGPAYLRKALPDWQRKQAEVLNGNGNGPGRGIQDAGPSPGFGDRALYFDAEGRPTDAEGKLLEEATG